MGRHHHSYAYVCTLCDHLASRHLMTIPGGDVTKGPYACMHAGCNCEIDQSTPLTGIDEATCNARFYPGSARA